MYSVLYREDNYIKFMITFQDFFFELHSKIVIKLKVQRQVQSSLIGNMASPVHNLITILTNSLGNSFSTVANINPQNVDILEIFKGFYQKTTKLVISLIYP